MKQCVRSLVRRGGEYLMCFDWVLFFVMSCSVLFAIFTLYYVGFSVVICCCSRLFLSLSCVLIVLYYYHIIFILLIILILSSNAL
jgi:hypothetical protein